MEELLI